MTTTAKDIFRNYTPAQQRTGLDRLLADIESLSIEGLTAQVRRNRAKLAELRGATRRIPMATQQSEEDRLDREENLRRANREAAKKQHADPKFCAWETPAPDTAGQRPISAEEDAAMDDVNQCETDA